MKYYDAKIRLKGNVQHEVNKTSLSAPEIIVIRRIHGSDAVVNITETDVLPDYRFEHEKDEETGKVELIEKEFDPIEERARLHDTYGAGLAALDDENKTTIERLFGGEHAPLIDELPEFKKKPETPARRSSSQRAPAGAPI